MVRFSTSLVLMPEVTAGIKALRHSVYFARHLRFLLCFALHPWLNEECPFSFFYLSVLVLPFWIAGTGPAVLSIVLGFVAAENIFHHATG